MREARVALPDPPGVLSHGIDAIVRTTATSGVALRKLIETDLRAGKQIWSEMDDDHRAALTSLVSEVLIEMAGNVEAWLDEALVASPDQSIGIHMLLKMGRLDEQIWRQRDIAAAEREQRIDELMRISDGTVVPAG